ncbi:N-acetyltransferase [Kribbella qitaiheensis]|uniref:N-acetyltransferase n=1 Tax=Kribbella qitaiheensis TaxID=1544730 RepID=A0A7G6X945_9ACTN|nr:N-acetyltransferase [Kribbella qitaiheensis]
MAAIREVNLLAFGKTLEPDLVEGVRSDPAAWLPQLSLVAVDGEGVVVGHILFSRVHIGLVPVLSLGPLAVLPAYQGQGVGGALIRAGLAASRAAGEHLVILLGHADYYPRFGFKLASDFDIHVSFLEDGPNLMVLPLDDTPVPAGVIEYPALWGN